MKEREMENGETVGGDEAVIEEEAAGDEKAVTDDETPGDDETKPTGEPIVATEEGGTPAQTGDWDGTSGEIPETVKLTEDEIIEQGKTFAMISYFSLFFIIVFVSQKDNKLAMFHAKQSMVLHLAFIALYILSFIATFMTLGLLVPLPFIVVIGYLVYWVLGIVKAGSGEYYRIPFIANYADKIKI